MSVVSSQDYQLLAQLNTIAATTYGGMADRAVDLVALVESVTEKCTLVVGCEWVLFTHV